MSPVMRMEIVYGIGIREGEVGVSWVGLEKGR